MKKQQYVAAVACLAAGVIGFVSGYKCRMCICNGKGAGA